MARLEGALRLPAFRESGRLAALAARARATEVPAVREKRRPSRTERFHLLARATLAMVGLVGFWTRRGGPTVHAQRARLPGEVRKNLTAGQRVALDLVFYAWALTAAVAARETVTAADLLEVEEPRALLGVRYFLRAFARARLQRAGHFAARRRARGLR